MIARWLAAAIWAAAVACQAHAALQGLDGQLLAWCVPQQDRSLAALPSAINHFLGASDAMSVVLMGREADGLYRAIDAMAGMLHRGGIGGKEPLYVDLERDLVPGKAKMTAGATTRLADFMKGSRGAANPRLLVVTGLASASLPALAFALRLIDNVPAADGTTGGGAASTVYLANALVVLPFDVDAAGDVTEAQQREWADDAPSSAPYRDYLKARWREQVAREPARAGNARALNPDALGGRINHISVLRPLVTPEEQQWRDRAASPGCAGPGAKGAGAGDGGGASTTAAAWPVLDVSASTQMGAMCLLGGLVGIVSVWMLFGTGKDKRPGPADAASSADQGTGHQHPQHQPHPQPTPVTHRHAASHHRATDEPEQPAAAAYPSAHHQRALTPVPEARQHAPAAAVPVEAEQEDGDELSHPAESVEETPSATEAAPDAVAAAGPRKRKGGHTAGSKSASLAASEPVAGGGPTGPTRHSSSSSRKKSPTPSARPKSLPVGGQ